MENNANKQGYRDALLKRIQTWTGSDENRGDVPSLFDFVAAVALDSYKNGLAQGTKRASTTPPNGAGRYGSKTRPAYREAQRTVEREPSEEEA